MSTTLWILQGVLAAMFVFAGVNKLVNAEMRKALGRPLAAFIGLSEIVGAIGLIAPLATGVLPQLTAIAAAALALVMVLAAIHHLRRGDPVARVAPALVLLVLTSAVAYGRW
jgi:hypothetical protein